MVELDRSDAKNQQSMSKDHCMQTMSSVAHDACTIIMRQWSVRHNSRNRALKGHVLLLEQQKEKSSPPA